MRLELTFLSVRAWVDMKSKKASNALSYEVNSNHPSIEAARINFSNRHRACPTLFIVRLGRQAYDHREESAG